jgi:hypothetical protein
MAHDAGWAAGIPEWNVPGLAFEGLLGLQIFILNVGVLYSLWILWRKSLAFSPRHLAVFWPWAFLAIALYALGLWLMFQPMDMRGTLLMP